MSPSGRLLDGIAVVSDIVASNDPYNAAKKIATIVKAFKTNPNATFTTPPMALSADSVKQAAAGLRPEQCAEQNNHHLAD